MMKNRFYNEDEVAEWIARGAFTIDVSNFAFVPPEDSSRAEYVVNILTELLLIRGSENS